MSNFQKLEALCVEAVVEAKALCAEAEAEAEAKAEMEADKIARFQHLYVWAAWAASSGVKQTKA